MLKPASPKKSPRHSLSGREMTDEQFSPQKQRFSSSSEKAPPKIRKLDFNRSLRLAPTCSHVHVILVLLTLFINVLSPKTQTLVYNNVPEVRKVR